MFGLFATLGGIAFVFAPVAFVIAIVQTIRKKPSKKRWWIIWGIALASMIAFELIAVAVECKHTDVVTTETPPSCTERGETVYTCEKCSRDKKEYADALGHQLRIVSRVEPTENLKGEIVRGCERCDYEEVEDVAALPKLPPSPVAAVSKSQEQPSSESELFVVSAIEESQPKQAQAPASSQSHDKTSDVDRAVKFAEIYKAFKKNELAAKDVYNGNRYQITATINGISSGGLFNFTGGATLTMETKVDNTTVFFLAEFEKEQEDALKRLEVGDTITFIGTCYGGTFSHCALVR